MIAGGLVSAIYHYNPGIMIVSILTIASLGDVDLNLNTGGIACYYLLPLGFEIGIGQDRIAKVNQDTYGVVLST